jgi:hypothetical protein
MTKLEREKEIEVYVINRIGLKSYEKTRTLVLSLSKKRDVFGWSIPEFIRECIDDHIGNPIINIESEIIKLYGYLKEFNEQNKYCSRCEEMLPNDEFYKEGNRLSSYCKECKSNWKKENQYASKYYQENKNKWTVYTANSKWHQDSDNKKEYHRNYYQNVVKIKKNNT